MIFNKQTNFCSYRSLFTLGTSTRIAFITVFFTSWIWNRIRHAAPAPLIANENIYVYDHFIKKSLTSRVTVQEANEARAFGTGNRGPRRRRGPKLVLQRFATTHLLQVYFAAALLIVKPPQLLQLLVTVPQLDSFQLQLIFQLFGFDL